MLMKRSNNPIKRKTMKRIKNIKRRLDVTKEVRENLAKVFNTTSVSVWRALTFRDDSENSRKMRCYAVENGGIVMNETPEIETIHDCDGYMRQYFPGDVMIEVNKGNGDCTLLQKGATVKCWPCITIQQLTEIQEQAAELCCSKVAI